MKRAIVDVDSEIIRRAIGLPQGARIVTSLYPQEECFSEGQKPVRLLIEGAGVEAEPGRPPPRLTLEDLLQSVG